MGGGQDGLIGVAQEAGARILTYGGIVQSLETPDRAGKLDDVVLGFDDLQGYVKSSPYFGAIVGRYGNRIAGGRFTLDGKTYKLAANNGPNALHGGTKGFDKLVWAVAATGEGASASVTLTLVSPDGDIAVVSRLNRIRNPRSTDPVTLMTMMPSGKGCA